MHPNAGPLPDCSLVRSLFALRIICAILSRGGGCAVEEDQADFAEIQCFPVDCESISKTNLPGEQ